MNTQDAETIGNISRELEKQALRSIADG